MPIKFSTNLVKPFTSMFIKSQSAIFIVSIVGLLVVGYFDYITGVEVRVFPLYFLPLLLAAWNLKKTVGLCLSLLATILWVAAMYFGGHQYSHPSIWLINFFTQGSAFVIVTFLIARLRDALDRENALSRMDNLTGLSNSRSFYEKSASIVSLCHRNARPVTLAYVDLDNFKCVNDTLGHFQGDELLRRVANIFQHNLRSSDLAARMGGDEFVLLLPETMDADAQIVLEKIRGLVANASQLQACPVTVSIGAVSCSHAPADINEMIKVADELMYEAKKIGRNRVIIKKVTDGAAIVPSPSRINGV